MSLLSNIHILPKAGDDFKAKIGYGSFSTKFGRMAHEGGHHGLMKTKDSMVEVMKKYEGKIRAGGIGQMQAQQAYKKIISQHPQLDSTVKHQVKDVIGYYTKGQGASQRLAEANRRIGEARIKQYIERGGEEARNASVSIGQAMEKNNPGKTISTFGRSNSSNSLPVGGVPKTGSSYRPNIPLLS